MLLECRELVEEKKISLHKTRSTISKAPTLALIWVGEDAQTKKFISAKQKMAAELECEFVLHHFPALEERQLSAVIEGLSNNKHIDGLVLQLPLPTQINATRMINLIDGKKDIDNLRELNLYKSPTPTGIAQLLQHNKIDLTAVKTCILGSGRLVGAPLSKIFDANNWNYIQISADAHKHLDEISSCQVLISCTGVPGIIDQRFVNEGMIVVDGSGVDVLVAEVEKHCKAVTPIKGCIGPLTVLNLYENLFTAVTQ